MYIWSRRSWGLEPYSLNSGSPHPIQIHQSRYRENVAHVRQSRPDYVLGILAESLNPFKYDVST